MSKKQPKEKSGNKPKPTNTGKVFWGKSRYIDYDKKPRRRYVVVKDNDINVQVAKLTSIKKIDKSGKNSNPAIIEIKKHIKV